MTAPVEQPSSTNLAVAQRVPLWRDMVVVKWFTQVSLLAIVLAALWLFVGQAGNNLRAKDITIGFDFIDRPVDLQLSEGIDTLPNSGGRALWVGMVNTLRVAAGGIVVATILGIFVALSRLSNNWMLRKVGAMWVEGLRNVPLLVQIIFYSSILAALPRTTFLDPTAAAGPLNQNQGPIHNWLHISNKGLSIPRVFIADGFYQWAIVILLGAIAAYFVRKKRLKLHDETGRETSPILWAAGTLAIFGFVGLFIHPVFSFVGPIMGGIASLIDSLTIPMIQALISVIAVLLALRWIRKFRADRRSGSGHLNLSDDDWFRMIFAGLASVVVIVVIYKWTGLSSWLLNSGQDLFRLAETKFNVDGAARPFDAMRPDVLKPGKFANYGLNGLTMTRGFAALFFGVTFYHSAHVGEILRGGILSVPKGQIEAASAIGLNRAQSLRRVILPQAFRISLPPLGNQYLSLTKNTSLAIAVGYSDIVQVGQTIYNQTGKALPVMSVWMLFYLACSLTISVVVNFFNMRLELVER